ncbi:MAG: oligosaccharide flippase family protein, partial [Phormidesmis sp.]
MSKNFLSYQGFSRYCKDLLFKVKNNIDSRKVIVDTGWQVLEKIIRLGSAIVSGILLARYLQPEQYGIYNYALAFTSFFATVSNLGSNQIFTRDLVKEPEQYQEIISTA